MTSPRACGAPSVERRSWPVVLATAIVILSPRLSTAQVAPVGGHHLTTGPAAASTNVSPSGAYSTSVPLDLPAGRGSIPIPLSIVYNGSSRVGAAGAGWEVPLSFVRRSQSTMRRKPRWGLLDFSQTPRAAERVVMSLGGAPQYMAPTSDPNVFRPAVARAASELRYQPDTRSWHLYTSDGLHYVFAAADSIAPSSTARLTDPELYYLTAIERIDGRDRLVLDYEVRPGPELNLIGIRYSFQAGTSTPLYDIRLVYRDWNVPGVLRTIRDSGYTTTRRSLLDRVDITKRDVFTGSTPRRYRSHHLTYAPDTDTGAPRLIEATIIGEEHIRSGPASLPLARYSYGRLTTPDGTIRFRGPSNELVGNGDHMADGLSASEVTREEYEVVVDNGPLAPRTLVHERETISLSRLTHDFTGDGLPDYLYKSGGRWHMVFSQPTDGRMPHLYDNPADNHTQTVSWREPSELSVESVFNPDTTVRDSPERRYSRFSETWVTFLDWNGDGLTDVLDARGDDWTVWINDGLLNNEETNDHRLLWRRIEVSTQAQRAELESRGYDLAPEAEFGVPPTYWLPIARSRSGPRIYWNHCEERTYECTDEDATYCDLDDAEQKKTEPCESEDNPGVYNTAVSGAADTWREWSITDTNGDSYPDLAMSAEPIDWCNSSWGNMWLDDRFLHDEWVCHELQQRNPPRNDTVEWHGPGIYYCKQSTTKELWPGTCPNRYDTDDDPINTALAFLNNGGALFSSEPFLSSSIELGAPHIGGLGLWTNAVSHFGRSNTVGSDHPGALSADIMFEDYRDTGSLSREVRELRPTDDGLFEFQSGFRFSSDRDEKCTRGAPPSRTYRTEQLDGRADINGDGVSDDVRFDHQANKWWVTFRSGGTPVGERRELVVPGGFSLSVVEGTCSGTSKTLEGLLDMDGDGKPEHVRSYQGGFAVSYLVAGDPYAEILAEDAHGAGRLVGIDNGYGAITRIDYDNAKMMGDRDGRGVPTNELVVARIWVAMGLGAVGTGTAPTYYFYQSPRMTYDQVWSSMEFGGYDRMITISGLPVEVGSSTIVGTAHVVEAWQPLRFPFPTAYERQAFRGLPEHEYLLEGEFALGRMYAFDPRNDENQTIVARRTNEYDVKLVSALNALNPQDAYRLLSLNCGQVDTNDGELVGDSLLCSRAGIVYTSATEAWEGGSASAATDPLARVEVRSETTNLDAWGRPLRVRDMGDIRTPGDDVCRSFTYAEPTGDLPFLTAVATLRTDDCGLANAGDTSPGDPVTLAGVRFVYDGLSEGLVAVGRLSSRVVERYDVSTGDTYGALLEEFTAERVVQHDGFGNPLRVERPRSRGIAATQVTRMTYDAFGFSLLSREVSSTDIATVLKDERIRNFDDGRVRWRAADGDVHTYHRDTMGRYRGKHVSPTGNGGDAYYEEVVDYDDTPSNRNILVRRRPGARPGDATTPQTQQRTYYDAAGRTVSVHDSADSGQGWVGQATLYDRLGRVSFVTARASVPETRYEPSPSALPYGTTYFYSKSNDLTATVDGAGMADEAGFTDVSAQRYVSRRGITYRDGLRAERIYGPGDIIPLNYLPTDPRYGQQYYTETLTNGSEWVVARTRGRGASTWFDGLTFEYDRLGRQVATNRRKAGASPVTWRSRLDSLGNELERTEPGTTPVSTSYDEWGQPLETRWAEGDAFHRSTWRYDGMGRPQEYRQDLLTPVGHIQEYAQHYYYDEHSGSPHQPNERVAKGALSWVHVPGVGDEYYTHDSLTSRSTTTTVHADENVPYRTVETRSGTGRLHALRFELPGRTETVSYAYDVGNRLRSAVLDAPEGSTTLFNATVVDELGRYRDITLGNGVRETFTYDPTGPRRLRGWTVEAAEERFERIIDARDADGRTTWLRQIDGPGADTTTWHYDYDRVGRLTRSQASGQHSSDESFAYDELGNLLTGTGAVQYAYDGADGDRLSAAGAAGSTPDPIQYDSAGNVTAYTPIGKPSLSLQYDGASRIKAIRASNGDQADFVYGPSGLAREDLLTANVRQQRRHYGALIERRVPQTGSEVLELQVPGPLGNIASLRRQPSAANDYSTVTELDVVYTHGDGQANRLFTSTSGDVAQKAGFRAYGAVDTADPAPSPLLATDNLWNGGDTFANFGITRLGARLYDPTLGRFLQRDPIRITASSTTSHPYAFAWGDPVNLSDPTGLSPCNEDNSCPSPPIIPPLAGGGGWFGRGNGHRPTTPPPPKRGWFQRTNDFLDRTTNAWAEGVETVGTSATMALVKAAEGVVAYNLCVYGKICPDLPSARQIADGARTLGTAVVKDPTGTVHNLACGESCGLDDVGTAWGAALGGVLSGGGGWFSRGTKALDVVSDGSLAIVRQADEVLEQAVITGPETISGFRIWGNKGLVGSTFNRNILLIEAVVKGRIPLRTLATALEAEASAAGASRLSIVGHAVINRGFTAAVVRRFGYSFRQINPATIELVKELP
jgi:RHS repeat-associated protein